MTIVELREKRAKLWAYDARVSSDTHRTDKGVLSAEDDAAYANMEKELNDLDQGGPPHGAPRRHCRRACKARDPAPSPSKPQKATGEAKTGRASGAYREDFGLHLRGKRHAPQCALRRAWTPTAAISYPTEFEKFIVDTLKEENVMRPSVQGHRLTEQRAQDPRCCDPFYCRRGQRKTPPTPRATPPSHRRPSTPTS